MKRGLIERNNRPIVQLNDMKLLILMLVVAGMFAAECQAGPETREKIKRNAKETLAQARYTTREVAAEIKELAHKGAVKAKELADVVAEHTKAGARKAAEVSKEIAAMTKEFAAETTEKIKEKFNN